MKILEVAKLSPQERFLYWIKERESIRLKKEAGKPKPWTDDEILQLYRFCNVRRMDDRVSQWLLHNWYEPNYDHENMVVACVLARHFNTEGACKCLHFPSVWAPKVLMSRLSKYKAQGHNLFNAAYTIHASKDFPNKSRMVIMQTCQQFVDAPIVPHDYDTMERFVIDLQRYKSIGSFMAGQIAADLRWSTSCRWSDIGSWAPLGPGSSRGINRLLGLRTESKINQHVFNDHMDKVISLCACRLQSITSRLEAIDIQNCLCEFDKYCRALLGDGKPKQYYDGVGVIELRKPQRMILQSLLRSRNALSRNQIAERSGVDPTKIGDYAGPRPYNQADKAVKRWNFPALDTLGMVAIKQHDVGGRDLMLYTITPLGVSTLKE